MHLILETIVTIVLIVFHMLKSLISLFIAKRKKDVSDDIVLVTGAGSGLGRLIALRFVSLRSTLVLWDVNEKNNLETVEMIERNGGKAFAFTCDLSNRNEIYKTAERVKSEVGKVTILINNAGIVTGKYLLESPDEMIEKTFQVNIMAHFWTVKAFLPDMMVAKKGHIVTIASLAGHFGISRLVDYSSSKAAAIGFNDALTSELRETGNEGIRTTCVCTVFVSTGMFDGIRSRFFPILTPESTSKIIVKSVLTNRREVIVPTFLSTFLILKPILPVSVNDDLRDLLINKRTMDSFRGRPNDIDN